MSLFKRFFIMALSLFAVLVLIQTVYAEMLRINDPATGTMVKDGVIYGVNDTFPASVEKVYAFTRIVGATTDTFVTHKWYYENELMAVVEMPVRSNNWRVYSRKNIMPEWTGRWRVDILDEDGSVIYSLPFTVR